MAGTLVVGLGVEERGGAKQPAASSSPIHPNHLKCRFNTFSRFSPPFKLIQQPANESYDAAQTFKD